MAEIDTDDIHPALMELLGEWSEALGRDEEQIAQLLKLQYELDLAEIDGEDATRFKDAYDESDVETMVDVLESNGVSEEHIKQFKAEVEALSGDDSDGGDSSPSGNGASPDAVSSGSGGGSDGLSEAQRKEVGQIVQQSTPGTDEIAQKVVQNLQNQSGGGGGGGGEGQPQAQQQQLGQLISLAQLAMGDASGGGGMMSEVGEKFFKNAMNAQLKRLNQPSFGEIVEQKMMEDMGEEYAEQYREEMFADPEEQLDEIGEEADDGDDDGESDGWSIL